MSEITNKTMSRSDLFAEDATSIVDGLNELIQQMYSKGLFMSSWAGSLPGTGAEAPVNRRGRLGKVIDLILGRKSRPAGVGIDNRGPDYEPLSGADPSERNQLSSERDLIRSFLSTGHFELAGNRTFYDNQESYLVHPEFDNAPYTFGAMFLKKTYGA